MGKLLLGTICIAFSPIFVKATQLGPTMIGFYRCLFAGVILLAYCLLSQVHRNSWPRKSATKFWLLSAAIGLVFALDLTVWHRSVIYAGAGMATILGNTQVFYLALIGILLYKEPVARRYLISVPLAFFGIYLLVYYHVEISNSPHYWLGIFYGLLTGVLYSIFLICVRNLERLPGPKSIPFKLAIFSLFAAAFLLLIGMAEGETLQPQTHLDWLWLLGLAIIPQIIGWLLISNYLPKAPISLASLILLFQPILATLMGVAIFDERLSLTQIGGAALTLFAIYLGTTRNVLKQKQPLPSTPSSANQE